MFLLILALLPIAAAISNPHSPQHMFANPPSTSSTSLKIPTIHDSAILARRILALTPLGTLSTIFPSSSSAPEQRPHGIEGKPIGLMDYIADCEDGNPTILAINIATSFKNVEAGSNISLGVQWTPPYPPSSRISRSSRSKHTFEYSAANLPRFSLLGYLEKIPGEEVERKGVGKCFVDMHPDARHWLPGNRIHESEWVRLVVEEVYWIGGFGDRAYIGWIPVEEWRGVKREEWEGVRLPGEKKGWREWGVETLGWVGGWEL